MAKKLVFLLSYVLILSSWFSCPAGATEEIFKNEQINKFGIHLGDTNNLEFAAGLVNSSEGDWGWVTVVIRDDELNRQQWQDFFDRCRELHLVPIVRLATHLDKDVWIKPQPEIVRTMAEFLNNLNWPIKQKIIIAFNELNHGKEWGGKVDPGSYAETYLLTASLFHEKGSDYLILFAGPDQVAPDNPPFYLSAVNFYRQAFQTHPELVNAIEGLASHSYPNHGFVGLPTDKGWGSIRGYEAELSLLQQLGVNRELPVFISETGWPHKEGQINNNAYYPSKKLDNFLEQAIRIWNNDKKIISFTPFILYFPEGPFSNFSWLDQDKKPYPFYESVQKVKKSSWRPPQINNAKIASYHLPLVILPGIKYTGELTLINQGQKIWGEKGSEECFSAIENKNIETIPLCLRKEQLVLPGRMGKFDFFFEIRENASSESSLFLRWENVSELEIKPLLAKEIRIYRPKTGIMNYLRSRWYNFMEFIWRKKA